MGEMNEVNGLLDFGWNGDKKEGRWGLRKKRAARVLKKNTPSQ